MSRMLTVSPEQVRWFRARQTGLAEPLPDHVAAARASLGIQSQQLAPSLWGVALRSADAPSAAALKEDLHGAQPSLVRTWGQRGTIHLYDPEHWRAVIANKLHWWTDNRRALQPPDALLEKARGLLQESGGKLTRSEVMPLVTPSYLREVQDYIGDMMDARRLAAGRVLQRLTMLGELAVAEKRGAEQVYAARALGFPKLPWPRLGARAAAERLTEEYFAQCGPATVQDAAHFFGARVGDVRRWVAALEKDGTLLACRLDEGNERELLFHAASETRLREAPPGGQRAWPVRLLPLWDGLLMSHADKSWTVLQEAERKLIWKKAAMVSAVILARGEVVGTWTHKARARQVDVTLSPLSGWRKTKHLAGATRAAQAFAAHLGRDEAVVRLAD